LSELIFDIKQIVKDGDWFRDNHGRYLLFRGVNFASRSKMPPYLPIAPLDMPHINYVDLQEEINNVGRDLDHLKDLGFNVIRLLIMWKALEPVPNPHLDELLPEAKKYLEMIKVIIDKLHERRLFVILDFHQDIAHEICGGDGFPDWALAIDEFHLKPINRPLLEIQKRTWYLSYYINHLVMHTLKSFWNNSLRNIEFGLENYPVRTHLEKTIGQTVKYLDRLYSDVEGPIIIGVEAFNEPHQVGLDRKDFESRFLREFYINVFNEIKKVDDKFFIFIEPRVDWNVNMLPYLSSVIDPTEQPLLKEIESLSIDKNFIFNRGEISTFLPMDNEFLEYFKEQGVLSFHYYDPQTISRSLINLADDMNNKKIEWPSLFQKMKKEAVVRNLIPFLTEFGGSHDWKNLETNLEPTEVYKREQTRAYMDLQFKQIEDFLLNSSYWNFDLYNTQDEKDNWNLENFSLLGSNRAPRNFDIVARPYPICSSAKPKVLNFDLKSKYATIMLEGQVQKDRPTIIYIPAKYHYPNFRICATSSEIQWIKQEQLLYWYPDKNKQFNQIIIRPDQELDINLLSVQARELLSDTIYTFSFN
jgi:Cellulase (glycosyl hydrolase family 5)/Glycoside hydrolase family 5 C-terminal domain